MNGMNNRVYLDSLKDGYLTVLQKGFEWINLAEKLRPGDRVIIKPNLTFPYFRKGVVTNPEAIEKLIVHLKNFTNKITICESDSGGYNRFSMDEVFRKTGIDKIAHRYGVRIVNMSYEPSRPIEVKVRHKKFSIPLPILLLDETDLFITMPVPKIHMNTIVSIAIKNQWGIIQEPSLRLKLHPCFKEAIYLINKALPKTVTVVDGKYGLTRSGPMQGTVIDLNWILITGNIFYADFVVTHLMGIDYCKINYLKYIFTKEGINSLNKVKINTDIHNFKSQKFYLKRKLTDYPGLFAFKFRPLSYLAYFSPLAKCLHKILYLFREPFYNYEEH